MMLCGAVCCYRTPSVESLCNKQRSHFSFIVVSELVMPVVICPCCGDFQCRQKLVSYNDHHSHLTMALLWSVSSNGSQSCQDLGKKNKKKTKPAQASNQTQQRPSLRFSAFTPMNYYYYNHYYHQIYKPYFNAH